MTRQRVLVVDDDATVQAVLSSALSRRGYEVDVASDGLEAFRMLRQGGFDLALIDYQLPEMDGLATARLLQELMQDEDRPKLIAVTSSPDSLSERSRSARAFDAIVPKSSELSIMLATVDTHLRATTSDQAARAALSGWQELGMHDFPSVIAVPTPTPAQAQLLRCYFDLSGQREPEAVLLLASDADHLAVTIRSYSAHFAQPLIDVTGKHRGADAAFSVTDRATWAAVTNVIRQFAERRQQLGRGIIDAADLETRLLAYLFLSGQPLQPAADYSRRDCVRYSGFFPDGETRMAAETLADRGLLDRRFFERHHVCGACGSSRLNVREECPACHSAQLKDVPLLHHFRCSYQAAEDEFTQGPNLVCPKCRQTLRHYGSDYDRPGTATACGSCHRVSPEPEIGFACLDCGGRTSGEAAAKRDAFAYSLTPQGVALLRRGTARAIAAAPAGTLPKVIQDELARGAPVAALLELRYAARADILGRRGEHGFAAMRRLFLENLVNALQADCVHASEPDSDYLLIRSLPDDALAGLGPALLEACQEVLVEGLAPEMRRLEVCSPLALAG